MLKWGLLSVNVIVTSPIGWESSFTLNDPGVPSVTVGLSGSSVTPSVSSSVAVTVRVALATLP